MKKWKCNVCGYIHEGDEAPKECPQCGAAKEEFALLEEAASPITVNVKAYFSDSDKPDVKPFFNDYQGIAAFIYNLPAGSHIPLHKHPTTDEIFYIIKGRFRFTVGDQTFEAAEGDVIQGHMNVPHTFENIGDGPAAFLSVKGPKPVDRVML